MAKGDKVDVRRLSPKGVAAYAPLASNHEDAGRQKNGRVELVEQSSSWRRPRLQSAGEGRIYVLTHRDSAACRSGAPPLPRSGAQP